MKSAKVRDVSASEHTVASPTIPRNRDQDHRAFYFETVHVAGRRGSVDLSDELYSATHLVFYHFHPHRRFGDCLGFR